jgi:hypothetical protein
MSLRFHEIAERRHRILNPFTEEQLLLLVGEPYWIDEPPGEAYAAITDGDRELFTTLAGTLDRIDSAA